MLFLDAKSWTFAIVEIKISGSYFDQSFGWCLQETGIKFTGHKLKNSGSLIEVPCISGIYIVFGT